LKNPISSIKEKITQYIQLRFELIRLEIIERLVNVMGYFAFMIIAIFLGFLIVFFVFLALAALLTQLFSSEVLGYFCTALIILVCSFFVFLSSKKIIRFFAGKMAWLLTRQKEDKKAVDEDEA
jgi:hypothetical protein